MPRRLLVVSLWMAVCLLGPTANARSESDGPVRPPAVAGQFYPDDPAKLSAGIRAFLAEAVPASGQRPIALIAPHAGYLFCGQIMADAFKQAAGQDYEVVVVLGTNHTTPGFSGVSIYPEGSFQTPLGRARIDRDLTRRLKDGFPEATFREDVHRREHSIEVLVPFIQTLFPKARLVPVIVGAPDPNLCQRFGERLGETLKGRRALIVASSDLSHYPAYDDAVSADRRTLTAVLTLDPGRISAAVSKTEAGGVTKLSTAACGLGPILTAVTAAKVLGATCGRWVSYANSGDMLLGRRDQVVGYGAIALDQGQPGPPPRLEPLRSAASASTDLTPAQKKELLDLTRRTIDLFLTTQLMPLARGADPVLDRKQGAFVTLKKAGQLRGCIGHMAEDRPLRQVVGAMALQAAFSDRRFPQLTLQEWPGVEIEISVLTPFRPVAGPAEIQIGRDGVVLEKGGRSAVFLPQVAVEQSWSREEMLGQLCKKAGLEAEDWRSGARLSIFQAVVFGETDHR